LFEASLGKILLRFHLEIKLSIAAHNCDSSYMAGIDKKILVQASLTKKTQDPT
jgi:hypothetical protein